MLSLLRTQIRSILPSDHEALTIMIGKCGSKTQSLFRPVGDFYVGGGANYYISFKALGGQVYIAKRDRNILGLAYFYKAYEQDYAYFGILVADPYQRQGVGNKLMQFIEGKARDRGFRNIKTSGGTQTHGPLRQLLLKRGYLVSSDGVDVVMMEKKL